MSAATRCGTYASASASPTPKRPYPSCSPRSSNASRAADPQSNWNPPRGGGAATPVPSLHLAPIAPHTCRGRIRKRLPDTAPTACPSLAQPASPTAAVRAPPRHAAAVRRPTQIGGLRSKGPERWAERRDKRLRPVGERNAVHLGDGPQRAAHLAPDAPRLIMEWDSCQWVPVTTVDNCAAAQRMLHGIEDDGRMELPTPGPIR
ncbi:DUF6087 family protein [Streptomyces sp. NPDC008240]|uniref:DUF6087 family protein n=1 Tax=Streptomyces sp. NPDC008240 TaxID=3364822 RepID=UPI0036E08731